MRDIQTLGLLVFADTQSHDRPHELQDDVAAHPGPDRRGNDADGLNPKLVPVGSKNSNLLSDPNFTTEMLADQRAARPV